MSKSTPIEHLGQDRDIVQDVLDDLDNEIAGEQEVDYDEMDYQHQDRYRNYQHDPSQVSQYHEDTPLGGHVQDAGPAPREMMNPPSWGELIWEHSKSPLLFIILFAVFSLQPVQAMIVKYLPEAMGGGLYSLAIRSVLGAVVFYLLRVFIMPLV